MRITWNHENRVYHGRKFHAGTIGRVLNERKSLEVVRENFDHFVANRKRKCYTREHLIAAMLKADGIMPEIMLGIRILPLVVSCLLYGL